MAVSASLALNPFAANALDMPSVPAFEAAPMLLSALPVGPTDSAVTVNAFPPSSVGVNLPILGSYKIKVALALEKSDKAGVASSDVVVALPADLVKTAFGALGGDLGVVVDGPGLPFSGAPVAVHLGSPKKGELDVAVNSPPYGKVDVTLNSPLIPKLPIKAK